MRLSSILTAAAAAATLMAPQAVSAQTSADLQRAAELQKQYPLCALGCMQALIPNSTCTATDVVCLCTNTELNEQISVCVLSGCTTMEGLQTKNVSSTLCGAEVRDKSHVAPAIGVSLGAVALVVFILRMFAGMPANKGRKFGWEDWIMIAAVVTMIPPTIFAVILGANGLGKDMWTLPQENIETVLLLYYLGELFYFASQGFTKLSLLFFLLRVFPERVFQQRVYYVIALTVAYAVAFIVATAFQCRPIAYTWRQIDSNYEGTCNNINMQGWMSAILNIVVDLVILALPVRQLMALHMGLKKKVMLVFMFSLGVFVTIISVIRLQSLIVFANTHNPTWDYLEAAYWSTIELHVGIMCACLPHLRQLFIALGAKVLGSTAGNSAGTGARSGGGNSSGTKRSTQLLSSSSSTGVNRDETGFVQLEELDVEKDAFRDVKS